MLLLGSEVAVVVVHLGQPVNAQLGELFLGLPGLGLAESFVELDPLLFLFNVLLNDGVLKVWLVQLLQKLVLVKGDHIQLVVLLPPEELVVLQVLLAHIVDETNLLVEFLLEAHDHFLLGLELSLEG